MSWTVHLVAGEQAERVQHHQAAVLITITRWLARHTHPSRPDPATHPGGAVGPVDGPSDDLTPGFAATNPADTDPQPAVEDWPARAA